MKKSDGMISVLDPKGQPTGVFRRRLDPNSQPGAILDPGGQPSHTLDSMESLRMAPRLENLEDKVVYLVDTRFAGH